LRFARGCWTRCSRRPAILTKRTFISAITAGTTRCSTPMSRCFSIGKYLAVSEKAIQHKDTKSQRHKEGRREGFVDGGLLCVFVLNYPVSAADIMKHGVLLRDDRIRSNTPRTAQALRRL